MRIGIHIGSVTAGITGTNIVRYDIYGPDVTVANLMESEGESGKVNVSETVKNLLEEHEKGKWSFVYNKQAAATFYYNGTNEVYHYNCYFIEKQPDSL